MKNVIVLFACIIGLDLVFERKEEKKEVKVINCKVVKGNSVNYECK